MRCSSGRLRRTPSRKPNRLRAPGGGAETIAAGNGRRLARIRFRDIHNRLYETDYSPTHIGCRVAGGAWKKNYGVKKKTGAVCVMVQQNGADVGGAPCESIHP